MALTYGKIGAAIRQENGQINYTVLGSDEGPVTVSCTVLQSGDYSVPRDISYYHPTPTSATSTASV